MRTLFWDCSNHIICSGFSQITQLACDSVFSICQCAKIMAAPSFALSCLRDMFWKTTYKVPKIFWVDSKPPETTNHYGKGENNFNLVFSEYLQTFLNVNIIFKRTIDLKPIYVDQYILLCILSIKITSSGWKTLLFWSKLKGKNTMNLAFLQLVK